MSASGKNNKDSVILIPLERTGNVMFQMAAVYSYCRDHSYTPCIDTSNNPCAASLNKFLGDPLHEKKAHGLLMDYRSLNYLPIPDKKEWACLRGWFQDRRFFLPHEEEIREIFSPLTGVTEPGRVGIHLRLGDYLGSRFSKDYYTLSKRDILRSLEHMRVGEKDVITVFTDTPDLAHAFLPTGFAYAMDDAPDPFTLLRRMSSCEKLVASASTLSWWAAYLGRIPHVVAFTPWTKFHPQKEFPLPEWTVLERSVR